MADNKNDKNTNLGPDSQRQRTGQPGEAGKPQGEGPAKVGNQDQRQAPNKMPPTRMPSDKDEDDDLDIDVDDRSPQRAPQPGTRP